MRVKAFISTSVKIHGRPTGHRSWKGDISVVLGVPLFFPDLPNPPMVLSDGTSNQPGAYGMTLEKLEHFEFIEGDPRPVAANSAPVKAPVPRGKGEGA